LPTSPRLIFAIVLPNGTREPVPVCPDIVPGHHAAHPGRSPLPDSRTNPLPVIGVFGRAQPEWRKYVNAATGYTDMFTNNEILGPANGPLRGVATMLPAGLGENADNKICLHRPCPRVRAGRGDPRENSRTTPKTFYGEPFDGQPARCVSGPCGTGGPRLADI